MQNGRGFLCFDVINIKLVKSMRENKKLLFMGLFIVYLIVISAQVLPVQAVNVKSERENFTWTLNTEPEGHTYMYVDDISWFLSYPHNLIYPEDIRIVTYKFGQNGWSRSTNNMVGPGIYTTNVGPQDTLGWGWLYDVYTGQKFMDIQNLTNIASPIVLNMSRSVFPVSIGTTQQIVLENMVPFIGTFNLTNEEFCHVTFGSAQDDCEMTAVVVGPGNLHLGGIELADGASDVLPIKPVGPGMYTVIIWAASSTHGALVANLLVQPVTPDVIEFGELVEGVLTGSKLALDPSSNAVIYKEIPPSIHTYRLAADPNHPCAVLYSLNEPELIPLYTLYSPRVVLKSNTIQSGLFSQQFADSSSNLIDAFSYQSFEGESYYISLIGMENTGYVVYNTGPITNELPLNTDFLLSNNLDTYVYHYYSLDLSEDSIMLVNKTVLTGSDTQWNIYRVFEGHVFRSTSIQAGTSLSSATPYYLPAGKYVVVVAVPPTNSLFRFTVGPVLNETGSVSIQKGKVVGMKAPVSATNPYMFNFTLTTRDNITVTTRYHLVDQSGLVISSGTITLGNRQNGGVWQAYGQNTTYVTRTPSFNTGNCVIVLCPTSVVNNTVLPGTEYPSYTVDYLVSSQLYSRYLTQEAPLTVDDLPVGHNFTLPLPGTSTERYALRISCNSSTWFTVRVRTSYVNSWTAIMYQSVNGRLQYQPWSSLDDTFSGDAANGQFEFGSIGNEMLLLFIADRNLDSEGTFNVTLVPHITNVLSSPPPVMYRGAAGDVMAWLAQNWPFVAAGVGAVVVVVAVVIYKKRT